MHETGRTRPTQRRPSRRSRSSIHLYGALCSVSSRSPWGFKVASRSQKTKKTILRRSHSTSIDIKSAQILSQGQCQLINLAVSNLNSNAIKKIISPFRRVLGALWKCLLCYGFRKTMPTKLDKAQNQHSRSSKPVRVALNVTSNAGIFSIQ